MLPTMMTMAFGNCRGCFVFQTHSNLQTEQRPVKLGLAMRALHQVGFVDESCCYQCFQAVLRFFGVFAFLFSCLFVSSLVFAIVVFVCVFFFCVFVCLRFCVFVFLPLCVCVCLRVWVFACLCHCNLVGLQPGGSIIPPVRRSLPPK